MESMSHSTLRPQVTIDDLVAVVIMPGLTNQFAILNRLVDVIPKMLGTAPSPRGPMGCLGSHSSKTTMQWSSSEDCNMLDDLAVETSIRLANLDLGGLITIDDGLSMSSPTLVQFKVTKTTDSSVGSPPPQPQPTIVMMPPMLWF
jgi:hypothetical protein